ncbi:hypothetical protein AAVH_01072 [Aphelenchoides avenae]|nr:hypothetical protein AAVH_01072 [Aphelenchus avenae]
MRRKPCRWMLVINKELRRLKQESRVLKRVAKNITFLHCGFESKDHFPVNFSTELCGFETMDYAKVVRFHYKDKSQSSCASLYEEGPCHEWLEAERRKPENASKVPKRLKKIKHCRGLLGVPMPNDSYVSADQGVEIIASSLLNLAPAVANAYDLTELLGTVVLASELVVKCPRCKVLTRDFKLKDPYLPQIEAASEDDYKTAAEPGYDFNCKWFPRMLGKEIPGWPAVAENCDRFEVYRLNVEETACCNAASIYPEQTECAAEPHLNTLWQNYVQREEPGAVNTTVATSTAL